MMYGSDRSKVIAFRGKSLELIHVRGEKDYGGQTGRTDGVALGDSLGGVADCVQRIGDGTNGIIQFGHFGHAAGVVGDGP